MKTRMNQPFNTKSNYIKEINVNVTINLPKIYVMKAYGELQA